jgi:hypothetical protein
MPSFIAIRLFFADICTKVPGGRVSVRGNCMATQYKPLSPVDDSDSPRPIEAFVKRWIYVFMAVVLIAIVIVRLIPDSIQKISAVSAGQRPAFPSAMHLHAVLMGA